MSHLVASVSRRESFLTDWVFRVVVGVHTENKQDFVPGEANNTSAYSQSRIERHSFISILPGLRDQNDHEKSVCGNDPSFSFLAKTTTENCDTTVRLHRRFFSFLITTIDVTIGGAVPATTHGRVFRGFVSSG